MTTSPPRLPDLERLVRPVGYGLGRVARGLVSVLTSPRRLLRRLSRSRVISKLERGRSEREGAHESWVLAEEGWPRANRSRPYGPAPRSAGLRSDGALEALSKALSDPDPATRWTALEVVTEFSEDRAGGLLQWMIHDPDPRVRIAAMEAAARMAAPSLVFSLILALEDHELMVREAAAASLEEITARTLEFDVYASPETRRARIEELKSWWKERRWAELTASDPEGSR